MGGWFAYEKEFEKAEANDMRGTIFTVHYENMKKVHLLSCRVHRQLYFY
jgi:hypothetical protein